MSPPAFTNIDARRNADGSVDLRFSTDLAVADVSLAPQSDHALLGAALMAAPDVLAEHDGFRLGRMPNGQPVLQFRFGQERWLSILLQPDDLEVLRRALTAR